MSATNTHNQSSVRKHLGNVHHMREYLYESQKGEPAHIQKHKKMLDDAAIKAIILDSRPFGDFRKPGMQLFLERALPGYRGPHRTTVSRRIRPMYDTYCVELKKYLETIPSVSLTCDLWKLMRKHFICVTVHFFDKDFNYQSFVIGFRQVTGNYIPKIDFILIIQ